MRSDRFNRAIKVSEQQVQSNSEVFNCTTDYRSIPQSMRTPRYSFLQSLYSKTNCVIKQKVKKKGNLNREQSIIGISRVKNDKNTEVIR